MNILLVYSSMTGNTEEIANAIADGIRSGQFHTLTKIDIFDDFPDNLQEYDCLIIGSYTWGDGDIPDEMLDLYEELEEQHLTGKVASLFGSGDTSYDYFCGSLDIFEEQLRRKGVLLPFSSIKIEMEPSQTEIDHCRQYGENLINFLNNTNIHSNLI